MKYRFVYRGPILVRGKLIEYTAQTEAPSIEKAELLIKRDCIKEMQKNNVKISENERIIFRKNCFVRLEAIG